MPLVLFRNKSKAKQEIRVLFESHIFLLSKNLILMLSIKRSKEINTQSHVLTLRTQFCYGMRYKSIEVRQLYYPTLHQFDLTASLRLLNRTQDSNNRQSKP